ncbi:unnamed protein product, partial [Trichogramma brassicae]
MLDLASSPVKLERLRSIIVCVSREPQSSVRVQIISIVFLYYTRVTWKRDRNRHLPNCALCTETLTYVSLDEILRTKDFSPLQTREKISQRTNCTSLHVYIQIIAGKQREAGRGSAAEGKVDTVKQKRMVNPVPAVLKSELTLPRLFHGRAHTHVSASAEAATLVPRSFYSARLYICRGEPDGLLNLTGALNFLRGSAKIRSQLAHGVSSPRRTTRGAASRQRKSTAQPKRTTARRVTQLQQEQPVVADPPPALPNRPATRGAARQEREASQEEHREEPLVQEELDVADPPLPPPSRRPASRKLLVREPVNVGKSRWSLLIYRRCHHVAQLLKEPVNVGKSRWSLLIYRRCHHVAQLLREPVNVGKSRWSLLTHRRCHHIAQRFSGAGQRRQEPMVAADLPLGPPRRSIPQGAAQGQPGLRDVAEFPPVLSRRQAAQRAVQSRQIPVDAVDAMPLSSVYPTARGTSRRLQEPMIIPDFPPEPVAFHHRPTEDPEVLDNFADENEDLESELPNNGDFQDARMYEEHRTSSNRNRMNWFNSTSNSESPDDSIRKFADILGNTISIMHESSLANANAIAKRMPSKKLPMFDGNPLEWLHFKREFEKSTEIDMYSDAENVARLVDSLRGEARHAANMLIASGEINSKSNASDWRWVPTSQNPADDATRLAPEALEQVPSTKAIIIFRHLIDHVNVQRYTGAREMHTQTTEPHRLSQKYVYRSLVSAFRYYYAYMRVRNRSSGSGSGSGTPTRSLMLCIIHADIKLAVQVRMARANAKLYVAYTASSRGVIESSRVQVHTDTCMRMSLYTVRGLERIGARVDDDDNHRDKMILLVQPSWIYRGSKLDFHVLSLSCLLLCFSGSLRVLLDTTFCTRVSVLHSCSIEKYLARTSSFEHAMEKSQARQVAEHDKKKTSDKGQVPFGTARKVQIRVFQLRAHMRSLSSFNGLQRAKKDELHHCRYVRVDSAERERSSFRYALLLTGVLHYKRNILEEARTAAYGIRAYTSCRYTCSWRTDSRARRPAFSALYIRVSPAIAKAKKHETFSLSATLHSRIHTRVFCVHGNAVDTSVVAAAATARLRANITFESCATPLGYGTSCVYHVQKVLHFCTRTARRSEIDPRKERTINGSRIDPNQVRRNKKYYTYAREHRHSNLERQFSNEP